MMRRGRAIGCVNLAVFLFATAAPLAKWIQLPALAITFGRVFISSFVLGVYGLMRGRSVRVRDKHHLLMMLAAGVILAIHWWTFLGAAQIATVAIATITFSTFPLFVTLIEPVIFHEKRQLRDVWVSILIVIGVLVTVPSFTLENRMSLGIVVGMISSCAYAILAIMNRYLSERYQSTVVSLYEQGTAAVVLLPAVCYLAPHPSAVDLGGLLFLGVVTTACAHTIFIYSMKYISATIAGIISSLESVYGIILALIVLGEVPSVRECIGAVIIIGAVIGAQVRKEQ